MAKETQAREGEGSSIADIVSASMSEIASENPDFFDETAHWSEDDPSLEFGDSSDLEDGEEDETQEDEGVPVKETTSSGGVGIDKVLQELDRTNPEYAKVVRGLQSEYTKSRNSAKEVDELKSEMATIVKEWQALKDQTANNTEDEDGEEDELIEDSELSQEAIELFENMDETHKELFTYMLNQLGTRWAQDNGFVKMSDIEEREAQKQAKDQRNTKLKTAVDHGIEEYGELFGSRDESGKFVINPEIRPKVETAWKEMGGESYEGTVLDLFKYACADEIIQYKIENPKRPSQGDDTLTKRMRASRVASSSSVSQSTPSFYSGNKGKNGRRKESVYDVAKRASRHTMSNV